MDINFEEVWNRVKGTQPGDELRQLYEFAADERRAAAEYGRLAACTGSARAKRLFRALAAEEHEHEKKLRAGLYLLNENERLPQQTHNAKHCGMMLQDLRRLYAAEQKYAEVYSTAADNTRNAQLRALYAELAEQERQHGRKLWELIMEMM